MSDIDRRSICQDSRFKDLSWRDERSVDGSDRDGLNMERVVI